jgi:hypothetical protein
MATVGEMLKKFQSVNVNEIAKDIIRSDPKSYIEQNQEQLQAGMGANNEVLPPYRSLAYARFKEHINPRAGGHPDYYLTGEMYRQMKLEINGDAIRIYSTVPYFTDLLARGGDPFGLSNEGKDKYVSLYLYDSLLKKIKDLTGTR